jgi:hypothetical protein
MPVRVSLSRKQPLGAGSPKTVQTNKQTTRKVPMGN